ncbi:hypothetical protein REPUB_Repub15cG0072000 [Reevesia pubescens]
MVFVENVPERVHWRWLKKVFQNFGRVVDVFIPRKHSGSGKKFAFVRFEREIDANRARRNLEGA